MTAQLYRGEAGGRLTDVTSQAGPPFQQLHVGRGLAVGDLDNDGRVDALMVAQNEPLVYFHNRTETAGGHYVTFQLQGTRSNRDGVGAVVTITAGGSTAGRSAVRRRKLPVGRRSQAPFRAGGTRTGSSQSRCIGLPVRLTIARIFRSTSSITSRKGIPPRKRHAMLRRSADRSGATDLPYLAAHAWMMKSGAGANSRPFRGARDCRLAGDCDLIVFVFRAWLVRVFVGQ